MVWCHLGGRIYRGETVPGALRRHAADTLAVDLDLPQDPQPDYVYQWFPPSIAPSDGTVHGDDPRKHAIGLSFMVTTVGQPRPRGEALHFAYFSLHELPEKRWPGTDHLIATLLARHQAT